MGNFLGIRHVHDINVGRLIPENINFIVRGFERILIRLSGYLIPSRYTVDINIPIPLSFALICLGVFLIANSISPALVGIERLYYISSGLLLKYQISNWTVLLTSMVTMIAFYHVFTSVLAKVYHQNKIEEWKSAENKRINMYKVTESWLKCLQSDYDDVIRNYPRLPVEIVEVLVSQNELEIADDLAIKSILKYEKIFGLLNAETFLVSLSCASVKAKLGQRREAKHIYKTILENNDHVLNPEIIVKSTLGLVNLEFVDKKIPYCKMLQMLDRGISHADIGSPNENLLLANKMVISYTAGLGTWRQCCQKLVGTELPTDKDDCLLNWKWIAKMSLENIKGIEAEYIVGANDTRMLNRLVAQGQLNSFRNGCSVLGFAQLIQKL